MAYNPFEDQQRRGQAAPSGVPSGSGGNSELDKLLSRIDAVQRGYSGGQDLDSTLSGIRERRQQYAPHSRLQIRQQENGTESGEPKWAAPEGYITLDDWRDKYADGNDLMLTDEMIRFSALNKDLVESIQFGSFKKDYWQEAFSKDNPFDVVGTAASGLWNDLWTNDKGESAFDPGALGALVWDTATSMAMTPSAAIDGLTSAASAVDALNAEIDPETGQIYVRDHELTAGQRGAAALSGAINAASAIPGVGPVVGGAAKALGVGGKLAGTAAGQAVGKLAAPLGNAVAKHDELVDKFINKGGEIAGKPGKFAAAALSGALGEGTEEGFTTLLEQGVNGETAFSDIGWGEVFGSGLIGAGMGVMFSPPRAINSIMGDELSMNNLVPPTGEIDNSAFDPGVMPVPTTRDDGEVFSSIAEVEKVTEPKAMKGATIGRVNPGEWGGNLDNMVIDVRLLMNVAQTEAGLHNLVHRISWGLLTDAQRNEVKAQATTNNTNTKVETENYLETHPEVAAQILADAKRLADGGSEEIVREAKHVVDTTLKEWHGIPIYGWKNPSTGSPSLTGVKFNISEVTYGDGSKLSIDPALASALNIDYDADTMNLSLEDMANTVSPFQVMVDSITGKNVIANGYLKLQSLTDLYAEAEFAAKFAPYGLPDAAARKIFNQVKNAKNESEATELAIVDVYDAVLDATKDEGAAIRAVRHFISETRNLNQKEILVIDSVNNKIKNILRNAEQYDFSNDIKVETVEVELVDKNNNVTKVNVNVGSEPNTVKNNINWVKGDPRDYTGRWSFVDLLKDLGLRTSAETGTKDIKDAPFFRVPQGLVLTTLKKNAFVTISNERRNYSETMSTSNFIDRLLQTMADVSPIYNTPKDAILPLFYANVRAKMSEELAKQGFDGKPGRASDFYSTYMDAFVNAYNSCIPAYNAAIEQTYVGIIDPLPTLGNEKLRISFEDNHMGPNEKTALSEFDACMSACGAKVSDLFTGEGDGWNTIKDMSWESFVSCPTINMLQLSDTNIGRVATRFRNVRKEKNKRTQDKVRSGAIDKISSMLKDINARAGRLDDVNDLYTLAEIGNDCARIANPEYAVKSEWVTDTGFTKTRIWKIMTDGPDKPMSGKAVENGLLTMALQGKYYEVNMCIKTMLENNDPTSDLYKAAAERLELCLGKVAYTSELDGIICRDLIQAFTVKGEDGIESLSGVNNEAYSKTLLSGLLAADVALDLKYKALDDWYLGPTNGGTWLCDAITKAGEDLLTNSINNRVERAMMSLEQAEASSRAALQQDVKQGLQLLTDTAGGVYESLRKAWSHCPTKIDRKAVVGAVASIGAFSNIHGEKSKAMRTLQVLHSVVRNAMGIGIVSASEEASGASMGIVDAKKFWQNPSMITDVLFLGKSYIVIDPARAERRLIDKEAIYREYCPEGYDLSNDDLCLSRVFTEAPQIAMMCIPQTIVAQTSSSGASSIFVPTNFNEDKTVRTNLFTAFVRSSVNDGTATSDPYDVQSWDTDGGRNAYIKDLMFAECIDDGDFWAETYLTIENADEKMTSDPDGFYAEVVGAVDKVLQSHVDACVLAAMDIQTKGTDGEPFGERPDGNLARFNANSDDAQLKFLENKMAESLRRVEEISRFEYQSEVMAPVAEYLNTISSQLDDNIADMFLDQDPMFAAARDRLCSTLEAKAKDYESKAESYRNSKVKGKKKQSALAKADELDGKAAQLREKIAKLKAVNGLGTTVVVPSQQDIDVAGAIVGRTMDLRLVVYQMSQLVGRELNSARRKPTEYMDFVRETMNGLGLDPDLAGQKFKDDINDVVTALDQTYVKVGDKATMKQFLDQVASDATSQFSNITSLPKYDELPKSVSGLKDRVEAYLGPMGVCTKLPDSMVSEIRDLYRNGVPTLEEWIKYSQRIQMTAIQSYVRNMTGGDGSGIYAFAPEMHARMDEYRKKIDRQLFDSIGYEELIALSRARKYRDYRSENLKRPALHIEDEKAVLGADLLKFNMNAAGVPTQIGVNGAEARITTVTAFLGNKGKCDVPPEAMTSSDLLSSVDAWGTEFRNKKFAIPVEVAKQIGIPVPDPNDPSTVGKYNELVDGRPDYVSFRMTDSMVLRLRENSDKLALAGEFEILYWDPKKCGCAHCANHGIISEDTSTWRNVIGFSKAENDFSGMQYILSHLTNTTQEPMVLKEKKKFTLKGEIAKKMTGKAFNLTYTWNDSLASAVDLYDVSSQKVGSFDELQKIVVSGHSDLRDRLFEHWKEMVRDPNTGRLKETDFNDEELAQLANFGSLCLFVGVDGPKGAGVIAISANDVYTSGGIEKALALVDKDLTIDNVVSVEAQIMTIAEVCYHIDRAVHKPGRVVNSASMTKDEFTELKNEITEEANESLRYFSEYTTYGNERSTVSPAARYLSTATRTRGTMMAYDQQYDGPRVEMKKYTNRLKNWLNGTTAPTVNETLDYNKREFKEWSDGLTRALSAAFEDSVPESSRIIGGRWTGDSNVADGTVLSNALKYIGRTDGVHPNKNGFYRDVANPSPDKNIFASFHYDEHDAVRKNRYMEDFRSACKLDYEVMLPIEHWNELTDQDFGFQKPCGAAVRTGHDVVIVDMKMWAEHLNRVLTNVPQLQAYGYQNDIALVVGMDDTLIADAGMVISDDYAKSYNIEKSESVVVPTNDLFKARTRNGTAPVTDAALVWSQEDIEELERRVSGDDWKNWVELGYYPTDSTWLGKDQVRAAILEWCKANKKDGFKAEGGVEVTKGSVMAMVKAVFPSGEIAYAPVANWRMATDKATMYTAEGPSISVDASSISYNLDEGFSLEDAISEANADPDKGTYFDSFKLAIVGFAFKGMTVLEKATEQAVRAARKLAGKNVGDPDPSIVLPFVKLVDGFVKADIAVDATILKKRNSGIEHNLLKTNLYYYCAKYGCNIFYRQAEDGRYIRNPKINNNGTVMDAWFLNDLMSDNIAAWRKVATGEVQLFNIGSTPGFTISQESYNSFLRLVRACLDHGVPPTMVFATNRRDPVTGTFGVDRTVVNPQILLDGMSTDDLLRAYSVINENLCPEGIGVSACSENGVPRTVFDYDGKMFMANANGEYKKVYAIMTEVYPTSPTASDWTGIHSKFPGQAIGHTALSRGLVRDKDWDFMYAYTASKVNDYDAVARYNKFGAYGVDENGLPKMSEDTYEEAFGIKDARGLETQYFPPKVRSIEYDNWANVIQRNMDAIADGDVVTPPLEEADTRELCSKLGRALGTDKPVSDYLLGEVVGNYFFGANMVDKKNQPALQDASKYKELAETAIAKIEENINSGRPPFAFYTEGPINFVVKELGPDSRVPMVVPRREMAQFLVTYCPKVSNMFKDKNGKELSMSEKVDAFLRASSEHAVNHVLPAIEQADFDDAKKTALFNYYDAMFMHNNMPEYVNQDRIMGRIRIGQLSGAVLRQTDRFGRKNSTAIAAIRENVSRTYKIIQAEIAWMNKSGTYDLDVSKAKSINGSTKVNRKAKSIVHRGLSNTATLIRMLKLIGPNVLLAAGSAVDQAARSTMATMAMNVAFCDTGADSGVFKKGAANVARIAYDGAERACDTYDMERYLQGCEVAAHDPKAQKMWKLIVACMVDGRMTETLSRVKNATDLAEIEKLYQENKNWVDRAYSKVANMASANGLFIDRQIKLFLKRFAMLAAAEGHDEIFTSGVIYAALEQDPAKVILDLLRSTTDMPGDAQYNAESVIASKALNYAMKVDMGSRNLVGFLLQSFLKKHPLLDVIASTSGFAFIQYKVAILQRVLKLVSPMSSIVYIVNKLTADYGLGKDSEWLNNVGAAAERSQIHHSLREAIISDMMTIGPLLTCAMIGWMFVELPDDDEKKGNPGEYKFFGIPCQSNWWIEDTLGLSMPLACFFASVREGKGDINVLANGIAQFAYGNPMILEEFANIMDFAADPVDFLSKSGEYDDEWYNADGSKLTYGEKTGIDRTIQFQSTLFNLLCPYLFREIYRAIPRDEKSYKYVQNADGTYERTDYEDAMQRKLARNNPLAALYFSLTNSMLRENGDPVTGYFAWEMPDVQYPNMGELRSWAITDEDGNMLPDADKTLLDAINILASTDYDDIPKLVEEGFFLPYDTRREIAGLLAREKDALYDARSDWFASEDASWTVLGGGDYETGRQLYGQITDMFQDQIDTLYSLYDKLTHEAIQTSPTKFVKLNQYYAKDDLGNVYASGYTRSLLNIFSPFMIMDANDAEAQQQWDYASVVGTPEMAMYDDNGNAIRGLRETVPEEEKLPASLDDVEYEKDDGEKQDDGEKRQDGEKKQGRTYGYGRGGYSRGGSSGGSRAYARNSAGSVYVPGHRDETANYSAPYTDGTRIVAPVYDGTRMYDSSLDYLRPDFQTKGSREAYRRSDY